MNAANLKTHGHSADVQIQLSVNGHVLPVTQIGPDFLVLRDPVDYPPSEAEIAIRIDDYEKRWRVWLVDGISVGQWKTRIARCQ